MQKAHHQYLVSTVLQTAAMRLRLVLIDFCLFANLEETILRNVYLFLGWGALGYLCYPVLPVGD